MPGYAATGPPAAGTAAATRRIQVLRHRRGCCRGRPAASIAACRRPAPAPPRARPGPRRHCWRRGTANRAATSCMVPYQLPACSRNRRTASSGAPGACSGSNWPHQSNNRCQLPGSSPAGAAGAPTWRRASPQAPKYCRASVSKSLLPASWAELVIAGLRRAGSWLGIRRVLLIISDPDRANNSTIGCSCHGPICHWPNQMFWPMASVPAAIAVRSPAPGWSGSGCPRNT